jgi:hypothetical protein
MQTLDTQSSCSTSMQRKLCRMTRYLDDQVLKLVSAIKQYRNGQNGVTKANSNSWEWRYLCDPHDVKKDPKLVLMASLSHSAYIDDHDSWIVPFNHSI